MTFACRSLLATLALLGASSLAQAQLSDKKVLTLEAAKKITAAAEAEAKHQMATVVIAVVDDGGNLLMLERLDDTQVASVEVAIAKARTASIFRRPTREFEEQIKNGRLATLVLPGAAPLQGGIPLVCGGQCIGAVGVSGNTPAQDEEIAIAGAKVAEQLSMACAAPSGPRAVTPHAVVTSIVRTDAALDAVLPTDARIEKVAEGFRFTEGPVWVRGSLLFSDPNSNVIYRWNETEGLSSFRTSSGYSGTDIGEYKQPGSNGLTLDPEGRLTICEHGNRRVTRLEKDGGVTVLADRYEGKRLNSPNDLVYRSDGALYFTDPPFGLPRAFDDPRKELPFSGVYLVRNGRVQLVSKDLTGPNGIALSPGEKFLYVGDWDEARKIVMRYDVNADGSLANGRVFLDLTSAPGAAAIDGIKVDEKGNLFVTGPGGLWIVSAEGKQLGLVKDRPEEQHNLAWGDADGKTLYIAALTGLYRLRLNTRGVRPMATSQE